MMSNEASATQTNEKALLSYVTIAVTEAEKRNTSALNFREFYTVYLIETKVIDGQLPVELDKKCLLWRRYSEFEQLKCYLEAQYPNIVVPPLPEKRTTYAWQKLATDTFDPNFIDRRRIGLENFILRVAAHHELSFDLYFLGFLQQNDGWTVSVTTALSACWKKSPTFLESLSAAFYLKVPDPKFEKVKNYSNELQSDLANILRIRASLVDHLYAVHKLHVNYGRIFSEWSAIEKTLGDSLQSCGHFMDGYATWIDSVLEDEETCIDQLKEYLFYTESLRTVCRNQEILQYSYEKANASLQEKSLELEKLQEGKYTSLMSKLLDSDKDKEYRMELLTEQIKDTENEIKYWISQNRIFKLKGLEDIERFHQQKAKDLRETLINYIIIQINICKKGINTWTNFRDSFA